jgi:hypothetical protein
MSIIKVYDLYYSVLISVHTRGVKECVQIYKGLRRDPPKEKDTPYGFMALLSLFNLGVRVESKL